MGKTASFPPKNIEIVIWLSL